MHTVKDSPAQGTRQHFRIAAIVLLVALSFIVGTALIDGGAGLAPAQWLRAPLRVTLNAWPGLVLAALLLALTRRTVLAALIAFLVEALLYGINALKVENLGTPLMPNDFLMLGQLHGGGGELLSGYLPHSIWPYAAILALLALVALLMRYEPPLLHRKPRLGRALLGSVSLLLLATLLVGTWPWPHVYDKRRMGMQPWSARATTQHTGLVNALMLFHLQYAAHGQKPNVAAARQMLVDQRQAMGQYMQQTGTAASKPDIVIVQSESFFDPGIMNGYREQIFDPNVRRLARHGTSGFMHVPTFGGGTIRTEFEVLTGMALRYFNDIQFPYLQIDQRTIPGLVRVLNAHGYETIAVHGNDPAFWNRASAFRKIGFDRFVSRAQFPPDDSANDGKYMSDRAMTDEILRQLKDSGPPQFIFAISIEAHGPYGESPGVDTRERDAIPVPASVTDPNARREVQNYIYHMRHADHELGRLVAVLEKRQRPTIVVFYGDHLPALVAAYLKTGFVNNQGFLTQMVPWLMLETHHPQPAVRKDTAAWLVPGMVLDRAGIHDDAYFALTRLIGPPLIALTQAPDAPPATEDTAQQQLDIGMRSITKLRLHGKFDALAATVEQQPPPQPIAQRRAASAIVADHRLASH